MQITQPLRLASDVVIARVSTLSPAVRERLRTTDDSFVVSRMGARRPTRVVEAEAGLLLEYFRSPTTLVDAVLRHSGARSLDSEEILDAAYTLVRSLLDDGWLTTEDDAVAPLAPSFEPGAKVPGGLVTRCVHLVNDTEVYQVQSASSRFSALKVAWPGAEAQARHEGRALRQLRGNVAPALLRTGVTDGRPYLLTEWIAGVPLDLAAREWRERRWDRAASVALRDMAVRTCLAYAQLHRHGVLHGDVHFSNVLIDAHDNVRLIDFGFAQLDDRPNIGRAGAASFFEPELARCALAHEPLPAVTAASEQYAVAALLYAVFTGSEYLEFALEHARVMQQIASDPPLSFAARGALPWPAVEEILNRALAKDPAQRFSSMEALASALAAAPINDSVARRTPGANGVDSFLNSVRPIRNRLPSAGPAPTASVNLGAAGVAYSLLRIALARSDAELLAHADLWAERAWQQSSRRTAFSSRALPLEGNDVGRAAVLHRLNGVWLVRALVADARDDARAFSAAISGFLATSGNDGDPADLITGRAGTLFGAALLLERASEHPELRRFGNNLMGDIVREIAVQPRIGQDPKGYLGMAHGWAGYLYALLAWSVTARERVPAGIAKRLTELARCARARGRGLVWPWCPAAATDLMPGWCHGPAGYVYLWLLAANALKRPDFVELAEAASWGTWDFAPGVPHLCCGAAGQAYAFSAVARATGDERWLDRAHMRAGEAARLPPESKTHPLSLFRGQAGVAALVTELQQPECARFPIFELHADT